MWKRIKNVRNKESSKFETKMRYFIFYPPKNSIKLIDVSENIHVEDILELVQKEFGLKAHGHGRSETSIVLSYNGFDLKPTWSIADLNIPSGSIIRCIYKEQQAAHLYIHCGYNKQLFKLFDSSITIETTIGIIRKKISDKLGLPLSTFCLETCDGKRRLYDQMKLINYDLKLHDHIYLKVWKGYEKFINSCIRGYADHYSHDDLIKHYQIQIALHIAAFYGHMELANSVMQHGARSDRPVGEHPSRQWSSELIANILPDVLKCPIHIAIERGHVKIVDLFVRHSILCTQVPDPITGYLPYRLALSCLLSAKTKQENQCYKEIYFYLHDKQYNLKVPLNANGDHVSNLLTSTTMNNNTHRTSTHHVYVSLPFYCRLMRWYERAHEKAWKKYGGCIHNTTTQTKRVYPQEGLLGYKVLIDGYNNTFEVPAEQLHRIRSSNAARSNKVHRYVGYNDEERKKILHMKTLIKQFTLDERQRAKPNLQQSRQPPLLLNLTSIDTHKYPMAITAQKLERISSSSEFSTSQILSNVSASDMKAFKSILETDNPSNTNVLPTELNNSNRIENELKEKMKRKSKKPLITITNEENKSTLPNIISPTSHSQTIHSSLTNKTEINTDINNQVFQPIMSSLDAYLVSSTRVASENEQQRIAKRRELFKQIEKSLQDKKAQSSEVSTHSSNILSTSLPADHSAVLDVDTYIPLPDHPSNSSLATIKSHVDLEIRQSTFQAYERYASASMRSTAINCLQEAGYFKRKSWIKQVEISKEMLKHKVQRRMHRANNKTTKKSPLLALHATNTTTTPTTYKTNTTKVN